MTQPATTRPRRRQAAQQVFLLFSGVVELGRKPRHLADSLGHRGPGRTGILAELLRQEADDSRRDCGGNELGALVASARDEHIHRLPPTTDSASCSTRLCS